MASREAWSLGPGQPNVAKRQCNFSRWLLSLDIFEWRVSRLERERVQQLPFWRLDDVRMLFLLAGKLGDVRHVLSMMN